MTLLAYTDGASRGNPGESGIGIIVKTPQGELVFSEYGYIGRTTNNLAEYSALLALIKRAMKLQCKQLIVHSDSELMVRQMNGEYKVKDQEILKLRHKIEALLKRCSFEVEIRHIPRSENTEADKLANLGIDSRKRTRT
jgi:ribonuclease HI